MTAISEVRPGYLLEHKGGKFPSVSWFLSRLLKVFERDWNGWGWHLSIAWLQGFDGWYILEATSDGVQMNFYDNDYLFHDTRIYKWFDEPPSLVARELFYQQHIGKRYDVAIYFWTGLAILIRHYFNRPIPKLLDQRYSCWELIQEFSTEMGKPIVSRYDVVIITDIIKALEGKLDNNSHL